MTTSLILKIIGTIGTLLLSAKLSAGPLLPRIPVENSRAVEKSMLGGFQPGRVSDDDFFDKLSMNAVRLLDDKGEFVCSGMMTSPSDIVSGGHCFPRATIVQYYDPDRSNMYFSERIKSSTSANPFKDKFDPDKPLLDFAIARIEKPASVKNRKFLKLATKPCNPGSRWFAIGFGTNENDELSKEPRISSLNTPTPGVDHLEFNNQDFRKGILCLGDSGSAIVCQSGSDYVIAGIQSALSAPQEVKDAFDEGKIKESEFCKKSTYSLATRMSNFPSANRMFRPGPGRR